MKYNVLPLVIPICHGLSLATGHPVGSAAYSNFLLGTVSSVLAGTVLWGEPVRSRLADIDEAVDLVDVFRNSRKLVGHTLDMLAMAPPGAGR